MKLVYRNFCLKVIRGFDRVGAYLFDDEKGGMGGVVSTEQAGYGSEAISLYKSNPGSSCAKTVK